MSKLKIEHGISRIKHAKLQTYIDQTIAEDIRIESDRDRSLPQERKTVDELIDILAAQPTAQAPKRSDAPRRRGTMIRLFRSRNSYKSGAAVGRQAFFPINDN